MCAEFTKYCIISYKRLEHVDIMETLEWDWNLTLEDTEGLFYDKNHVTVEKQERCKDRSHGFCIKKCVDGGEHA